MSTVTLHSLTKIPFVHNEDDIAKFIINSATHDGVDIDNGDLIVLAQKIVSKAEGMIVKLSNVIVSPAARKLAVQTGRDARLCQLYLDEASEVIAVKNPDASARRIREEIKHLTGKTVGIIINDSCGRDYRGGSVGTAIGVAGINALRIDEKVDLFGNPSISHIAIVDEVAAAASLLMGQANEGIPAVVVKGITYTASENATIQDFIQK